MGKKQALAEEKFSVDPAAVVERKKKPKRSKKDQGDAVDVNGNSEAEQENEVNEVVKKKKKKGKKDQGEAVGIAEAEQQNASDEVTVPKKKKKRKQEQEQEQEQEKAVTEKKQKQQQSDDGSEKKSAHKKNKKRKVVEEQSSGQTEAEVPQAVDGPSPKQQDAGLGIIVSGKDSSNPKFKPLESFSDAGIPQNVLQCCSKFTKPSPIQSYSWRFLLNGRDLIGIAATGSGKTLAFGVPAIMHVLKNKKRATQCLVLSPTRELAQQIAAVLEEAGSHSGVSVACLYGGVPKHGQKLALRKSPEIVVATPGRLQDLVDEGMCDLQHVTYLVLDEADRMLDLGFEPAVRSIVNYVSEKRQTIMFSATWPPAVEQLAKEFIQEPNPIKVIVGSQDLTANHDVTQIVEVIEDRARDAQLQSLLQLYHKSRRNRILIFVLYKREAVRLESVLEKRGWKVTAVHGDKNQSSRNHALEAFKSGTHPLLIATDVAARGLDIPDVEYVINYSFPLTTEDYVHRIGRTGRAGKKGMAHTFFTSYDKARAGELVNILREAGQAVPDELLKFGTHVKKKESALYGAHFKEIAPDAPKAQKIKFDSDDDE